MSKFRRRLMMVGGGGALPYDEELPCLFSNSRAYIDTGVAGDNDNLEIYVEYKILQKNNYEGIIGNQIDESKNSWRAIIYNNGLACNVNNLTSSGTVVNNVPYTDSKCTLTLTKQKVISNGIEVSAVQTAGTSNNSNIALFNRSATSPQYYNTFGLLIYLCKIYDNGALIRDFIPVRVGNEGCMYDRVHGELYYSVGTETFGLPQRVEYIENTATADALINYIPTGQDIVIQGRFYPTGYSGNYAGWFWGYSSESDNTYRIIRSGADTTVAVNCGTRASNGYTNVSISGLNTLYDFEMSFNSITINGITSQLSTSSIGGENTGKIHLWEHPSSQLYARGRWYSFRLYKSNSIVLNILPYRIGSMAVFIDTISKDAIMCQGQNSLIIGSDI